ncbi:MAG: FadR family transcriptional regulator [Moraxellaceae bacterium]|nr:MAG: FadR family transcriptional regulator [Moraxellaceae bacterium]
MKAKAPKPKNFNAQVVEYIGSRILHGHYNEGEKLPVESELSRELGVSRPILREATKILSSKGLLRAKPKVGTIVTERKYWNMLDSDVLGWLIDAKPADEFLDMLFDARSAIEPRAAELAALKATPSDLEKIRLAHEDMARVDSLYESIEPDIRFHQAILAATHNEVIMYIGHTLHNALAISFSLTTWDKTLYLEAVARHKAIYTAIAEGNPQKAGDAVRYLLGSSREDFNLRQAEEGKVPALSNFDGLLSGVE